MNEQESTTIIIGLILSWGFGILFALIGITAIFSEPIPGLVMLVMAAVLLPPVTKLVDQKWKFHLSGGMKIAVIIIGFFIIGSTVHISKIPTQPKAELPKKENQQVTNVQNTVSCKPIDDLTTFTCRYGAPDEDYNSADEKPQPLIITRMLTYKQEHVRAIYVPTTNEQPIEKWKLVAFQDPVTLKSISPEVTVERMKARDKGVTENNDEIVASVCAQKKVESMLKAPKSADFPWIIGAVPQKDGSYGVQSYVDAQNSFGATIRTNFVCKVKVINAESYKCETECILE